MEPLNKDILYLVCEAITDAKTFLSFLLTNKNFRDIGYLLRDRKKFEFATFHLTHSQTGITIFITAGIRMLLPKLLAGLRYMIYARVDKELIIGSVDKHTINSVCISGTMMTSLVSRTSFTIKNTGSPETVQLQVMTDGKAWYIQIYASEGITMVSTGG